MEKLALLPNFIEFEDLKKEKDEPIFSLCNYLHVHRE